jgi:integrase
VLAKAFEQQTGRTLDVHKPRESDKAGPVWTLAEARRFGEYVRGDRLYPMWRLLLVTGLRRGELCGLQYPDLEPDQGTLKVCRQLVVEDPGSRVRVKPPKSHNGVRTLLLDPVTLELLAEAAAVPGPTSRYLFTGRTARPLRARQSHRPVQPARSRLWCPAARAPSDPAPDRVESARRRLRHPRSRRAPWP